MSLAGRRDILSTTPGIGPVAAFAGDPAVRALVEVINQIVPVMNLGRDVIESHTVADRYFCYIGAAEGTSHLPDWLIGGANNWASLNVWDATEKRFYAKVANNLSVRGRQFIYPEGPYGMSLSHEPKRPGSTTVQIRFRVSFASVTASGDYGANGIGMQSGTLGDFTFAAGNEWVRVAKGASGLNSWWELGCADGTAETEVTTSKTSGYTTDALWHDWMIEWTAGSVKLYKDEALLLTATASLPTMPLKPFMIASNTAGPHANDDPVWIQSFDVQWV